VVEGSAAMVGSSRAAAAAAAASAMASRTARAQAHAPPSIRLGAVSTVASRAVRTVAPVRVVVPNKKGAVRAVAGRTVRTVAMADGPKAPKGPVRTVAEGTVRAGARLQSLQAIYPGGVNSVIENGEWEQIELAVDSGATETVVGEDMLLSVATTEGESFKRGVEYEVASGTTIPNLGEKCFIAVAEEGQRRKMRAQVCAVNKALLSVSRMVQAGNRVVFEQNGSYVEDLHSGEKMYMYEKGGMYMLKMWVEKGF
jgi:lysophospholipid acyltransferase (LPLAT)-like uncharacterized protein